MNAANPAFDAAFANPLFFSCPAEKNLVDIELTASSPG
jgi:hypothetical protein